MAHISARVVLKGKSQKVGPAQPCNVGPPRALVYFVRFINFAILYAREKLLRNAAGLRVYRAREGWVITYL